MKSKNMSIITHAQSKSQLKAVTVVQLKCSSLSNIYVDS